jgi:uncharacterized membrane protein
MPRVMSDALISMGALVLLLASLVSIDERVREHVTNMLTTPPVSAEIVGAGVRVEQVSALVLKAARDQSVEHAPMVIFAVVATVLVLIMLRT